MKNGIVYITFIRAKKKKVDRIKELEYSVNSLKKRHPNLSVTLFTDENPDVSGIDNVKLISVDSVRIKQNYLEQSPYDNTLYLDCDTRIVGPILEPFRLMERFDLAITHDLIRKDSKKSVKYPDYANIPDGFSEFGGGVMMFRKSPQTTIFFETWRENYKKWFDLTGEQRDQPSLRVSIWQCSDLKFYVLPPEFNIRSKKYNNIVPRIEHEHNLWRKK